VPAAIAAFQSSTATLGGLRSGFFQRDPLLINLVPEHPAHGAMIPLPPFTQSISRELLSPGFTNGSGRARELDAPPAAHLHDVRPVEYAAA